MSGLKVNNLTISINKKTIFTSLSFEVARGEILAIMGASGSGKSSLLSYIAGSLPAEVKGSGKLYLDQIQIEKLPILERKVGILFQDDLLFSHLNVGENLLFAMTEKLERKVRVERATKALQNAGLDGFFFRKPSTLSGGQRARVSLLRTLLSNPKIILLDEPFSKLDKSLRKSFRHFVFSEIKKQDIPCILVTHDPDDIPAGAKTIDLN